IDRPRDMGGRFKRKTERDAIQAEGFFGLLARHRLSRVSPRNALQEEPRGVVRDIEMQFKVRRLSRDVGRLSEKHEIRILKVQPLLRFVMNIAGKLGRAFRRLHFQKQTSFYRILEGDSETQ